MNKTTVEKMVDILSTKDKTDEDVSFLKNNLEGFAKFMLDMATFHLVKEGVSAEKVKDLLEPLVEVNKMLGVTQFQDFMTVDAMFSNGDIK